MRRSTLSRCALMVGATVVAGVVPALGADTPHADAKRPKTKITTTRLARGVTMTHSVFSMKGRQRVFTLRINLDGHNSLVAASPGRVIGARRQTALSIGRQERAVAGINGDTFYFPDPTAVPRGGLSYGGRIVKSALVGKKAVLYVTSSGRAAIGDPGLRGRIAATDRTGKARSYGITSVNSLENAENGGMSLVDPNVMTSSLQKPPGPNHTCAIVRLTDAGANRYRVGGITYNARRFTRAAAGTHAFVSCAAATKNWIRSALVPGSTIAAAAGYRVRGITPLLSGARQLIRGGRRYNDRSGINVYGNIRKPETFGCVLRGGRTVLLGVVEGDRRGRAGMTYSTLTTYLLQRRCASALVFDGSGSSTLVARRPGHRLAIMNKVTAPGGVRRVVNGLYVVRH